MMMMTMTMLIISKPIYALQ